MDCRKIATIGNYIQISTDVMMQRFTKRCLFTPLGKTGGGLLWHLRDFFFRGGGGESGVPRFWQ